MYRFQRPATQKAALGNPVLMLQLVTSMLVLDALEFGRLGVFWSWDIAKNVKKLKKSKKSQKCLLLRNHHSEIRNYLTKIRVVCHNVLDFQQLARKFKYQGWLSFLPGSIKKRITFDANWHHILGRLWLTLLVNDHITLRNTHRAVCYYQLLPLLLYFKTHCCVYSVCVL